MAGEPKSLKEDALEVENAGLRELLTQAGIDAARLLAQAGIDATENEVAKRLQRLLLEELHHRVRNTLATVHASCENSPQFAAALGHQWRFGIQAYEAPFTDFHHNGVEGVF